MSGSVRSGGRDEGTRREDTMSLSSKLAKLEILVAGKAEDTRPTY